MMRFIEGNCPSYEKERECGYGYSGITCEKCWKEALEEEVCITGAGGCKAAGAVYG
jgi:hypothetical protein